MLFLCLYSDKTIGFLTSQSVPSILSILKYGLKEGHSFDKVILFGTCIRSLGTLECKNNNVIKLFKSRA